MSQEQELWEIEKLVNEINNIEDLKDIRNTVRNRIDKLAMDRKYNLKPGMKVRITGSNKLERGIIVKVNRTRAVVDIDNKNWTVPFSMITEEIEHDTK